MRTTKIVSATLLMACVATATAGCADHTAGGSERQPPRIPQSARAQDDMLSSAEALLVRRCLAEKGLTLPQSGTQSGSRAEARAGAQTGRKAETRAQSGNRPGSARRSGQGAEAPQREFPYGIDDPDWASRHGFGTDSDTGQNRPVETTRTAPSRKALREEAARRQALADAMFGTGRRELSARTATGHVVKANSDGCLAAAQRTLYGDQERWFRAEVAVNNLGAETHQRVTADSEFRAVLARWSDCVAPVEPAEDPGELRRTWQRRARELAPEAAERLQRRFATAEARCVVATGLARTGVRLERRHTAEVRAEHAARLADHRRMRERGLRIAAGDAA
ncbi:hypothetical protein [Streptomyces sp. 8N706]|uniref:hypothetical protein n=1 Tax=Streptomyces sp. 8N706 TaxID=3457416 RepID=UPI003FD3A257